MYVHDIFSVSVVIKLCVILIMVGKKGKSGRYKLVGPSKTIPKLNSNNRVGRPKKLQSPVPSCSQSNEKIPENSISDSENHSEEPSTKTKQLNRPRRRNPVSKEWDAIVGSGRANLSKYRLPTKRVILQRYRHLAQSEIAAQWKSEGRRHDAITIITDEVLEIWNKSRVITVDRKNVLREIKKVVDSFSTGRTYADKKQKIKIRETQDYQTYLEELCDIAPKDLYEQMKSSTKSTWKEDYDFFVNQKKVPQVGHMEGVDKKMFDQEMRTEVRHAKKRKQLLEELLRTDNLRKSNEESKTLIQSEDTEEQDNREDEFIPRRKHRRIIKQPMEIKINSQTIMKDTSDLATRLKLSTNQQLTMVTKVVKVGGGDIKGNVFSRSTTWRHRRQEQKTTATKVKSEYTPPKYAISHHDSKMISYITGRTDERLAICISGDGKTKPKFIGAPKIPDGSGKAISSAVETAWNEWGVAKTIIGTCWDTTSSNSGIHEGANTHLEKSLDKKLLWIPCRHHEYELHIKHSNTAIRGPSKGETFRA